MEKTPNRFTFFSNKKLKQSRPGNVNKFKFAQEKQLCAYSVLGRYIYVTSALRKDSQLFISNCQLNTAVWILLS